MGKKTVVLSREYLKETFEYRDGTLYWRTNRGSNQMKGLAAGCFGAHGYWKITLNGKAFRAHRLVWLFFHGALPEEIDHINGDKLDNHIENLRAADRFGNTRNTVARKDNASGIKGVRWKADRGKWQARLRINGAERHLGYFLAAEAAQAAVELARSSAHGRFANNG